MGQVSQVFSMSPGRVLQLARRATLLLAVCGLGYLWWRFEVLRLPEGGGSPLVRFSPGSPLVVDRHPSAYAVGDAVFFALPSGKLGLGVIEEERAAGYWIVVDDPRTAAPSSAELGALEPGALRGRVLFALSPP